jgi:predicted nucleotidyltransferase component of viral defense system
MRDQLLEIVSSRGGYNAKLNAMREYLQAFMLRVLFKNDFFQHAAFLGGTCLRFIYNLKRFSEDLDFSLQKGEGFDFERVMLSLENELRDSGYDIRVKIKRDGVDSGMFRFAGLLFDAGMSGRKEENISIKIELDRRPPAGARTETHIIDKYFTLGITGFDLSTLFAGKINALLTRNYVKGRDYYDLFWYLTAHRDLQPNVEFLKNALLQFKGDEGAAEADMKNWKSLVIETFSSVDWKKIRSEVELLLEDREALTLFTRDNLLLLLNR